MLRGFSIPFFFTIMILLRFPALFSLLLCSALSISAWPQDPASPHDPAAHAGAGLKKELFAGITEADFLKLGTEPKTATVVIVAAFTDANYGMNFDGYSNGKAVLTIPTGWKVTVTFINPSPVPHSAIVVDRELVRKMQLGEPAFAGASTPSPTVGTSFGKATFSFTASEAGEYALACGFPTHAANGHWVALNVSDQAKAPTIQLGDAPAREAK